MKVDSLVVIAKLDTGDYHQVALNKEQIDQVIGFLVVIGTDRKINLSETKLEGIEF